MPLEYGTIITIMLAIISGVYGYGRLSSRVETNKESYEKESKSTHAGTELEHGNLWKVMGDVRHQLEDHLKDANVVRLEIEKEMGKIRGDTSNLSVKLDSMLETILGKLEDMKKSVEKLENKN